MKMKQKNLLRTVMKAELASARRTFKLQQFCECFRKISFFLSYNIYIPLHSIHLLEYLLLNLIVCLEFLLSTGIILFYIPCNHNYPNMLFTCFMSLEQNNFIIFSDVNCKKTTALKFILT